MTLIEMDVTEDQEELRRAALAERDAQIEAYVERWADAVRQFYAERKKAKMTKPVPRANYKPDPNVDQRSFAEMRAELDSTAGAAPLPEDLESKPRQPERKN